MSNFIGYSVQNDARNTWWCMAIVNKIFKRTLVTAISSVLTRAVIAAAFCRTKLSVANLYNEI